MRKSIFIRIPFPNNNYFYGLKNDKLLFKSLIFAITLIHIIEII